MIRQSKWVHAALGALLCALPAVAQSQQLPSDNATPQQAEGSTALPEPQVSGSIAGTIVDASGAIVAGAHVKLSAENQFPDQESVSDNDGRFFFPNVAPGAFQLTISLQGFTTQTYSGALHSGENYAVPQIVLAVASASTQVQVSMTPTQEAEAEIKDEEKQRVLGVLPNFYVTYNPDAVPLNRKQKFKLAWKATIDPVNFVVTAGAAGMEQASDMFGGYGQGVQGYAKRYGAAYADSVTATFIGSAILPSILKQDPRYFYKGTGSTRSRILYAIANAVICKGDNGKWQANYSAIAGTLASAGISNLYYPPADREGVELTFQNTAIGIASAAATNILQEFVIRKLTPHAPTYTPSLKPNGQ